MKILVLGAGAIGGYFGGRLADAGVDVTFLVRDGRRAQLERNGLIVKSAQGNLQLPVQVISAAALRPEYDFVLLTCKAYDLESAMHSIAPAVSASCAIVPVLNGMAHLDVLDARFGRDRVMGGTCAIVSAMQADGVIHHTGVLQRLVFGERWSAASERTAQLSQAFSKTSLDWECSTNIQQDLWEKIVFLSALAATTCLFRANIGEIMSAEDGHAFIERTLSVNMAIATREGFAPREKAVEMARRTLTTAGSPVSASMLRDLEAGKPVEADHIVGWMRERARKHDLDDTMLSLAFTHLKAYEARRAANRLVHPASAAS